jgi:predicted permease
VLGVATPLLFGLIPALQAARGDVRDALAAGGRTGAAPVRGRIRTVLVAVEVAVSLVLLVGATLLIRSFVNILEVDPGFDPRGVVTVHMAVPPTKYETPEQAAAFYARLVERLRTLPGVASAGATNQVPLSGDDYGGAFVFEGHPDAGAQADNEYDGFRYSAGYRAVTPGYLEALAVTLEKGRFLRDSDTAAQPPVAVVNEAFVRQFLPETDPIGVRFKYAGMDRVNPYFTIVGVIKDIHHASLVKGSKPETYVSLYQAPFRAKWALTMLVRAASPAGADAVAAAARDTIRALEPDTPAEISTLEHVLDDSIADRRFMLLVLAAFAAIAVVLAATGIYSVLSQTVAQRTQEIGIRMALGAQPARVMRLMLGSAMLSVMAGIVAGAAAALAGTRLAAGLLFGVSPADPIALAAGAAVLLTVALFAAWVPARRATRIDPLRALRY